MRRVGFVKNGPGYLPIKKDPEAIFVSTLSDGGKQGSVAPIQGDGPSSIGISAIGASAGAPDGGFGGGSSEGPGAADGGVAGDGGGAGSA